MKSKLLFSLLLVLIGLCNNLNAQVPNWAWANDTSMIAGGMTTDANGNLYSSSGLGAKFLVKTDNNGNPIWESAAVGSFQSPPAVQTHPNSVAIDASGNVFVCGLFTSDILTLGTTDFTRVSTVDMFIAKYDANGNYLWGQTLPIENVANVGYHLATDGLGNVIAVGSYTAADLNVGIDSYTNPCTFGGGCPSMLVIKYDGSGNVLWSRSSFSSIGTSYCYSVVTDANNNIYVGGDFLNNRTGIVKYDTEGNVVWTQEDGGWHLAIDNTGNLYSAYDKNIDDGIIKRHDSTDGSVLWSTASTGNTNNVGEALLTDANGDIYYVGSFRGSSLITFGTTTLQSADVAEDDFFIVKLDNTGSVLWATAIGGDSWDAVMGATVDPAGNVFVGGFSLSTSLSFDAFTLNILPAGYNFFFAKLGEGTITATIPADPTNFFADATSSSEIYLTWTDNATDENGYYIYYSTDNITYNLLFTTGPNAQSYTANGLDPNTMYYFYVQAFNTAGSSNDSNIEAATTFDVTATVPADPTSLDVNTYSASEISMSWGDNSTDEDGFKIERSMDGVSFGAPVSVAANVTSYFDMGLTPNTMYYYRVYAYNANGNSGYTNIGMATTNDSTVVVTPSNLELIAAASYSSFFQCNDGTVKSTGWNLYGDLGNGSNTQQNSPMNVFNVTDGSQVNGGFLHSFMIKQDGTVWGMGLNNFGQLGNNTMVDQNTPVQAIGLTNIAQVSAENQHTIFLKSDGTVWATGNNDNGQLGLGSAVSQTSVPMQITSLSNIVSIGTGSGRSFFVKDDGTVWSCGNNSNGQLGLGTLSNTFDPTQITSLSGVIAVSGETTHTLFLKNDGTVWSCGWNWWGQLGDGTNTQHETPVQVIGASNIVKISATNESSIFLKDDGTVWGCGNNGHGEIGDGTTSQRLTAVQALGLTNVTAISAGLYHVLYLKNDGTVWACGDNAYGQLGTGNTASTTTAIQVPGLCTVGGGSTTTVPASPTGLDASATSQTTTMLEWMDNSTDETSFVIYRGIDWVNYTPIDTVPANTTSYMDAFLSCNTFYSYKVAAMNSAGYSVNYTSDTTTTFDCTTGTVPVSPTGLDASATSQTTTLLEWMDNSTDETNFVIYRGIDWVNYTPIDTVTANTTSYMDGNLSCNTFYSYKVAAMNASGYSVNYTADTTTTFDCTTGTVPIAPSGLIATASSQTSAQLTWIDNSTNENDFLIKRSLDGVTYSNVGTVNANITSFSDNALTCNTFYYYKVIARNSAGNSTASPYDTTTTFNCTTGVPPAAPTNLIANAVSTSQINLFWNDNSNNETNFRIRRSIDNLTFTVITVVGANSTSYNDTGLDPSTTYYYKVQAFNGVGNSANSNMDTATTFNVVGAEPVGPTDLIATAISFQTIKLTWNDNSTNEDGFIIKRSLDGLNWNRIDTVLPNVTIYNNTGLQELTTYFYQVRAYNENGVSTQTNIDSATTLANFAGVDDLGNMEFKLYPNPTINEVTVELTNNEKTSAEIYSTSGELVQTLELAFPKTIIETRAFENGVYFMKVITDKKASVIKVVKQ